MSRSQRLYMIAMALMAIDAHKLLLAQREDKQRRFDLAPLLEAAQGQVVGAHAEASRMREASSTASAF